ncbi:cytochrome P450 [Sordaria brevicollis]|uniref:Cytochrome P450 n=1 Tax=Sordaria brevicollis TaxID=83679 RepID=A0AAE0P1U8_SORBR|nr:cytochrome P450 [Sordaria brevicollis]
MSTMASNVPLGNGTLPGEHATPLSWATSALKANMIITFGVASLVTLFLWFFISYQTSPLKKYPGPALAGWTNLWRLGQVLSGEYAPRMKKLHEKYGPIVRIGPNILNLDFPELTRTIYGTDPKWKKTNFYQNSSSIIDGKITYHMFSEVDNAEHARMKRPVVRHYSVPSVLAMEPLMDKVINDFLGHLQTRYIDTQKECEFGEWLGYYAWDFLGIVTFSAKFGYMEKGCDFDGTLAIADKSIDYLGICGQMPWMDYWLDKNPVVHLGPPNISNVTNVAIEKMTTRLKGEDKVFREDRPDFLQYFIESMSTHPDIVDPKQIIGYLLLNLIAGADTTAITMRALFYYSLKDARVWSKLVTAVRTSGIEPGKPAPHSIARAIPYLEAVIRETIRYHPAVSMIMERIVPSAGLALPDGSVVPGGSFVGMNPYIVGRNKKIFGEDADEFNPDRWLQREGESDEQYKERRSLYETASIAFGNGSRICLGRNLSQMELYKVVPTLIATYDIEMVDKEEEWWTCSRWFYRCKGVVCRLNAREDL